MDNEAVEKCDVSIVVYAHAEGRSAHLTMRSILASVEAAKSGGLRTETIIVLDDPSDETHNYFARWDEQAHVVQASKGDIGLGLNAAIARAQGKYVALVRADELLGNLWLRLTHERAEKAKLRDFVVHGEYTLLFDKLSSWKRHRPSNVSNYRRADLLHGCDWNSALLAPLATFRRVPFQRNAVGSGFMEGNWHWICNVLAIGGEVIIASDTCTFTRPHCENSPLPLIRPSDLFDPRHLAELVRSEATSPGKEEELRDPHQALAAGPTLTERVKSIPRKLSRATEEYPAVQKALGAVYRAVVPRPKMNEVLPPLVMQQWRKISTVEPGFFPSRELLENMQQDDFREDPASATYEEICLELGQYHRQVQGPQFTHIYLVPRLKRGGTDRVTINFILLTASNPAHRVLVVATEEPDSPWKVRLPTGVAFLNFCELSSRLNRESRKKLLARMLVQLRPQVIHNIYSLLGNQVFALCAHALSQVSRIYVPAYCVEVEQDGKPVGELISYLPGHAEYVTAVVSDNQYILNWLEETYALDPRKLFVHYQPVVMKPRDDTRRQPGEPLRVLWAGRLDRQKHPELMMEIARRCLQDKIEFHAYGAHVVTVDKAQVDFSTSPNVKFHGPFDGLGSLPTQEYDVFLNTSEWEGMPNILLEAVAEGLCLVASDVGGVSELVIHEETGMLINPFNDIDKYVEALRRLQGEPELCERLVMASRHLVSERHSWEKFASELNRLPGYLEHPCQLEHAELSRLEMPIPPEASPSHR